MKEYTLLFIFIAATTVAPAQDFNYLVGRGSADITGPAVGVPLWGFVREDQIAEGIHLRLRARAFIVAEPEREDARLALVVCDIGSVTHEMHKTVLERLHEKYGDTYNRTNLVLSATHTHAGPGGYWHYGAGSPLGGGFYDAHFNAIVDGIVTAVGQAHDDLEPGNVYVATGEVEGAGVNRSAVAYDNNPENERAKYEHNVDKTMTLLKFVDASGPIASVNWFAVHPTSMTYNNKLISGDHKGYAAQAFEQQHDASFVAAFAQANCGDVTPNLNLDNTGPGADDFESTYIIGSRQLEVAQELFESATEKIEGPIESLATFADLSAYEIEDTYTGAGVQHTCPSAYGYAFAAGSTEDGGGHPMFREGMNKNVPMIDNIVKEQFPDLPPATDEIRACQAPKAILFAPGATDPPMQAQVQPMGLARIGGLVLVVGPAEFTTMAGRRIRSTVNDTLGDAAEHVVIAGYSNSYAGYVTTYEEYQTQQYEGGHTLYGPWTLAAYQQVYTQLAEAMKAGENVEPTVTPRDIRAEVQSTALGADPDKLPAELEFGAVAEPPAETYAPGDVVRAVFWSAHPQNDYRTGNNYVAVQRQTGDDWTTIATDADWSTKIRWTSAENNEGWRAEITWAAPAEAAPGTYRIVHTNAARSATGFVTPFEGATTPFEIR